MHFLHERDERDDKAMNVPDVYRTLSQTPAAFRALLSAASPSALAFRESQGAWTAHEVLCHVTDGDVTDWRPRVAAIVAGAAEDARRGGKGDDLRRFTPFDREGGHRKYGAWPTEALLDEFERVRRDNMAYLTELNLDDSALEHTGLHPEFGAVTLGQLISCWAVHDLAHISQISRILVRHAGPDVGPWKKYFSLLGG